jgi:alpha-beta hydrolase superfamily lysophospholipase
MIKNYVEQFLFFPNNDLKKTPKSINIDYEDVYIQLSNDKYHAWFIQGNYKNSITQDKCIIFFHGNAGNISYRLNYIEKFTQLGFSQLYFDYPGFGLSSGTPNENTCIECANNFYQYIINEKQFNPNNIIFYGESIGGSIASSLANKYNIKYLILQSTFTDIKEIIKNIVNFNILLTSNIGFETLNNLKIRYKLNKLNKRMKTLVMHSNNDELIDISHGENLAIYSDSFYICSGSHSNISIDSDYIFNLLSFIKD